VAAIVVVTVVMIRLQRRGPRLDGFNPADDLVIDFTSAPVLELLNDAVPDAGKIFHCGAHRRLAFALRHQRDHTHDLGDAAVVDILPVAHGGLPQFANIQPTIEQPGQTVHRLTQSGDVDFPGGEEDRQVPYFTVD